MNGGQLFIKQKLHLIAHCELGLRCFFIAFLCLASGLAHSNRISPTATDQSNTEFSVLAINTVKKSASILPYLSFHLDGTFVADISDITKTPAHKWTKNTKQTQHFGKSTAPFWFKFNISNLDTNLEQQHFIKLDYPHHDKVSIYFVHEGRVVKQVSTGDHLAFSSRKTDQPSFVFNIPDIYNQLEVYLSVQSEGVLQLPLSVVTQNELSKQNIAFSLLSGIYFGAILIMLLYNGFIYITVKDRSYLYYLIYLSSCALIQLVLSGLAFQYIWPNTPEINFHAVIVSAAFTGISAITFIKNFIGIDYVSSKKDMVIIKLLICLFILTVISSSVISYSFALKSTFFAVSLMVITGFYLGVKYWLKGIKTARYFALAWFSYLGAVIIFLLENNRIIEPNIFNENALAIGTLIELTLLSIAFADRLNFEKNLRVEAQDALLDAQIKMNQDLDKIVNSRTEELELANTRLKELSVTDGLTLLKNRYYFDQAFKREVQRAARDNLSLSIIMIDIDHFKKLNDKHGHLYGDYCLTKSAELITAVVHRPSDTVARYGGEEIAILLPNTALDGAIRLAERIREQFKENEFSDAGIVSFLTVSIGVSTASLTTEAIPKAIKLLDIADQCLYKAKEEGRDKVVGQKCYFS